MTPSNPKWPKTTKSYKELKKLIKSDKDFYMALQASLLIAQRKAASELNADLYHALDNVFGGDGQGWPSSPDAYLDYVEKYLVLYTMIKHVQFLTHFINLEALMRFIFEALHF